MTLVGLKLGTSEPFCGRMTSPLTGMASLAGSHVTVEREAPPPPEQSLVCACLARGRSRVHAHEGKGGALRTRAAVVGARTACPGSGRLTARLGAKMAAA